MQLADLSSAPQVPAGTYAQNSHPVVRISSGGLTYAHN